MRLSLCSPPAGPLERAPLTALWASVASAAVATMADAAPAAGDGAECDGWWTADERYVLRVGGGGAERWYVGELEATTLDGLQLRGLPVDGGDAHQLELGAGASPTGSPRPPRDDAPSLRSRTMLVGRRRVGGAPRGAMRVTVRRLPEA